jgi:hypothetical protein
MDEAKAVTAVFGPSRGNDFNGDGKLDVLWHNQATGDLYVWFLDGTVAAGGSYLTPGRIPVGPWQIRGVADLDGDGKADLLWQHQTTGELYAWLMDGVAMRGGSYLTPRSVPATPWQIRALADFSWRWEAGPPLAQPDDGAPVRVVPRRHGRHRGLLPHPGPLHRLDWRIVPR